MEDTAGVPTSGRVATWSDLVVGVDLHFVLVGPSVQVLPHLFIGIAGDPLDAALSAAFSPLVSLILDKKLTAPAGPILVNGRPVLTTGQSSSNLTLVPHVPSAPGNFLQKPPGKAAHHHGDLTVRGAGSQVVRDGEVSFSCSDPVPLPTATVMVVHAGAPVCSRGLAGFSPSQYARSKFGSFLRRGVFAAVSPVARFVARHSIARLRNIVPKILATLTGDPVDIAQGRVLLDAVDFRLPGPLPFTFERTYSSAWADRETDLGYGWSHSLDRALWLEEDGLVCRREDGREIVLEVPPDAAVQVGGKLFDPVSKLFVERTDALTWEVTTPEGLVEVYRQQQDEPTAETKRRRGLARCVRISARDRSRSISISWISGRLDKIIGSGGHCARFVHDSYGRLERILLPDPFVAGELRTHAAFRYSERGDLVSERDADGHEATYQYRGHLLVRHVRRNGVTSFWGYDGASSVSRCVRTWERGCEAEPTVVFHQRLLYDPVNRRAWRIDADDNRTEWQANELGLVVSTRDALNGITTRTWDGFSLTSETDPEGNTTFWSYDDRGHETSSWREGPSGGGGLPSVGRSTTYHPDFPELPLFHLDERRGEWHYRYDERGNCIELQGPAGLHVTWAWSHGRIASFAMTGRERIEISYDDSANPRVLTSTVDGQVHTHFDLRGQIVEQCRHGQGLNAPQEVLSLQRTLSGRPKRIVATDGNVVVVGYDAAGNVTTLSDQLGVQRFSYTGDDWLASREHAGDVVTFSYHSEGELEEVRNEHGQSHRLVLDPCRRTLEEHGFDVRTFVRYRRDRAGRITEVQLHRRGGARLSKTKLVRDVAGRIVERHLPDGIIERFSWNAAGDLVSADGAAGALLLDRDGLGRTKEEHWQNVMARNVFDANGWLRGQETSIGAYWRLVIDGADPAHSILFLGEPGHRPQMQVEVSRDGIGRAVERLMAGRLRVMRRWDAASRLCELLCESTPEKRPKNGWWRDLYWSLPGRLSALNDSRGFHAQFTYDRRGRSFSQQDRDGEKYRVFDEAGNLFYSRDREERAYSFGGMVKTVGHRSSAPHDEHLIALEHDWWGNLVAKMDVRSDAGWRYDWSPGPGGLLTTLRRVGPGNSQEERRIDLVYDPLGRLVGRDNRSDRLEWVWLGKRLVHELSGRRQLVTWYHGMDHGGIVGKVVGSGEQARRFAFVCDHVNVPTASYGEEDDVAWHGIRDINDCPLSLEDQDGPPAALAAPGASPWAVGGGYIDADLGLIIGTARPRALDTGLFLCRPRNGIADSLAPYSPDPFYRAPPASRPVMSVPVPSGHPSLREHLRRLYVVDDAEPPVDRCQDLVDPNGVVNAPPVPPDATPPLFFFGPQS